eukprot:CAMPEP_0185383802 /NCGR_PEP_ID=MMETSP1364-20130426/58425_1 /TAXON_ID=38817 /ORGANISM="Gephyrocapsa oceanica, Strain RCC1303" /LENGTH=84 /DNA_ID=CAMNT_0027985547 /DNA_START=53 /DNA_END=304 /DNA_ORIENTATION=-
MTVPRPERPNLLRAATTAPTISMLNPTYVAVTPNTSIGWQCESSSADSSIRLRPPCTAARNTECDAASTCSVMAACVLRMNSAS